MGIFDKKSTRNKSEDFDSPIERVELGSATAKVTAKADPPPSEPTKAAAPQKEYGIEQAIALMRTLPSDSVELVVRVVKHTLESTDIDIGTIIEDATAKQNRIDSRVALLREEISDLESEIKQRSEEIGTLEEDHKETSMVKERLELAEKLDKQASGSAKPASKAATSASGPSSSGGSSAKSGLDKPKSGSSSASSK